MIDGQGGPAALSAGHVVRCFWEALAADPLDAALVLT